ncbi:hypothetical protein DFH08DRAFT_1001225 [Mycena albidolilacea]|uniref:Zn(2)-C6 fungal-type domain-containing protein n=1 Tax=Mycena albidolilacea TaxID=1033008 RepID=A0AAD7A1X4_9AGAR|nr:hypothetical protein DFH08DRAFT_1001225 [Mycena albidolilacea]
MAYGGDMDYPHRMQFPSWLSPFDAPPPRDDPPAPRITLAGSLDPTTGIFYRTPEHPRLRTAQACEKCRARKAKCSGDHPSCARCLARGLPCEYAKEGRTRGPNKPKLRAGSTASTGSHSSHSPQHSPVTLPYPTSVHSTKRRRRSTTLPTLSGIKLEPLSSCVPLALPSSSSNSHYGLSIDTDLHRPIPLKAHLPSADSMPVSSLSSPYSPQDLATISSPYTPYPNSAYIDSYTSEYTDSAHTHSRRGSFEGLPEWPRPPKAYQQDGVQDYVPHGTRSFDRSDRASFPLEPGYAREGPVPLTEYGFIRGGGRQEGLGVDNFAGVGGRRRADFAARGVGLGTASTTRSDLAMRRAASTSSLSGSGSTGSVDGGSAPPSTVSGSFPLFRARWPSSSHAYSPTHVYSPLSSNSASSYSTDRQNTSPMHPPYGMRPHSTYPHSHSPSLVSVRSSTEQDHSTNQYEPMQTLGPYDAQGRIQFP